MHIRIKQSINVWIPLSLHENIYGKKSRLLFTDTDSLIYEIETEDVYEDFSNDKEMFDFNIYLARSKCHDNSNKIVVG